ncbi:MAG: hypothetical protein EBS66_19385 [Betaproteobacteria bacterium]|nr:hypothetical protein [Betaproteobacteria bacterium]
MRQYDMANEGLIARKFMLGMVQTAEGLAICRCCWAALSLSGLAWGMIGIINRLSQVGIIHPEIRILRWATENR